MRATLTTYIAPCERSPWTHKATILDYALAWVAQHLLVFSFNTDTVWVAQFLLVFSFNTDTVWVVPHLSVFNSNCVDLLSIMPAFTFLSIPLLRTYIEGPVTLHLFIYCLSVLLHIQNRYIARFLASETLQVLLPRSHSLISEPSHPTQPFSRPCSPHRANSPSPT